MGTFSAQLDGNDEFMDVYTAFQDLLQAGKSPQECTNEVMLEFLGSSWDEVMYDEDHETEIIKFTADIKADPGLLHDDFKVPPLIIQPYVENAILHGLRNRTGNDGQLSISLNRLNGHIQYIIEDNGVGRMHPQNGHSNKKVSYGMQMSSDRVKLFNQEENASVEITDLVHKGIPAGTRVEVLLKMI